MNRPHLSGLYLYPVKSLRGCAVTTADFDAFGLVGDRRFMVVGADGRFLTQRTLPRMATIGARLEEGRIVLSAPGLPDLSVTRASDPGARLVRATLWKHAALTTEDCGEDAAVWLTGFLGVNCRLVRQGRDYERAVLKAAARPGDAVSFADACPFLLVGEASLADLNDRLLGRDVDPVPMDRFRPNLVVAGSPAYEEDRWPRLHIGDAVFRSAGPCARCVVTTTDQSTGERSSEPLATLASYRRVVRDPTNVNFGQNLLHETKSGRICLGDTISPLLSV